MEDQSLTYEEAREYLDQAAKKGIVLGLSVIRELMDGLGNPQDQLKIVHIAGTNGKGSILAYLEQIFLEAGYHTGRYVSPALGEYENRFLLDGKPMPKQWVNQFVKQIKSVIDDMKKKDHPLPTVFEIETAMAFMAFNKAKVSVVLLETGMGGRLDGTNLIKKPMLSILSSISMDHMAVLGESLEQIAKEKAGIIKEGCKTLLYPGNQTEVVHVIRKECEEKNSSFHEIKLDDITVIKNESESSEFSYSHYSNLFIHMPGDHQIYNAVTAVEAIEQLKEWFPIDDRQVAMGLKKTYWPARLEKVSDSPIIYLDGAHNEDGAKKLAVFLREHFEGRRILGVMGVFADKEYEKIAKQVLTLVEKAAVITPNHKRALDGRILRETALSYCSDVTFAGSPEDGVSWIQKEAQKDDVVIIFGSLSFMDKMGEMYGTVPKDREA